MITFASDTGLILCRASVKSILAQTGSVDPWPERFTELCATVTLQALVIAVLLVGRYRRRRAKAASEESESRFRQFADLIPHVIWMASPDLKKLYYVNAAYETVFGRSRQSLYADPRSWRDAVHPTDRDRISKTSVNPTGTPQVDELRVIQPDGTVRWIQHQAVPFRNSEGKVYLLAGIAEDITERRESDVLLLEAHAHLEERVRERTAQLAESEERFFSLAKAAFEGILIYDKGRILEVNAALAAMFGYAEAELIGLDPARIILPERRTEDRRFLAGSDLSNQARDCLGVRKDGSTFAVEFRGKPLPYQGRVVHVLAVRDISGRKRAEEMVGQHREELAHVLRIATMNEMATGLAHELNQPLAAIANYARGCIHRLQSGAKSSDVLEAMRLTAEQAERAGEIIRRMREFIRTRQPQTSSLGLNEIIRRVISLLRSELRRHEVAVQIHLSDSLPAVMADEIQIEQVVLNLLRNACEALASVKRDVRRVTIVSREKSDGTVAISVADNGPGIPQDDAGDIFDPFYTTKPNGMGMGLSISRSIIEAHGGSLSFSPNTDGGLTFTMTLPVTNREGIENEFAADCVHC